VNAAVVPPQDLEAERALLGSIVLAGVGQYRAVVGAGLEARHFSLESHRVVFEAMAEMEAIDGMLLAAHLRDTGRLAAAGGRADVDLLAASVPAVGHWPQYLRVVREKWQLRVWLRAGVTIQEAVRTQDWAKLHQVGAWCAAQKPESPS
jgi:replicative DNA helicase